MVRERATLGAHVKLDHRVLARAAALQRLHRCQRQALAVRDGQQHRAGAERRARKRDPAWDAVRAHSRHGVAIKVGQHNSAVLAGGHEHRAVRLGTSDGLREQQLDYTVATLTSSAVHRACVLSTGT